jgi:hypothetical protein
VTQDGPRDRGVGLTSELPDFDISVASPARIWNYWPDGKDH